MKVGIVGWRGMVGSVLIQRMQACQDFEAIEAYFFTTSQIGQKAPIAYGKNVHEVLLDAYSVDLLQGMDCIISCQGSDYTNEVFFKLRELGWTGFWIDAASVLRMQQDSVIVLDPLNGSFIDEALNKGIKTFVGGNCTVSLLLMAIGSLIQHGLVEWVSSMTYQAVSGAGARQLQELIQQMGCVYNEVQDDLQNMNRTILDVDKKMTALMRSDHFPTEYIGSALIGNVLPYIDQTLDTGQSREEWKAEVEANKILGLSGREKIAIDGVCARVGAMRSHSQALTIKLTKDISIVDIESILSNSHDWLQVVPNDRQSSIQFLTPVSISGGLNIALGRLRYLSIGKKYLSAFTVGDQLLWGAAEPLRRMLNILISR